jgi:hypothetical protein
VRGFWLLIVLLMTVCLSLGATRALSESYVLRFSDTPALHQAASHDHTAVTMPATAELDNPPVPADQWLVRQGWKQVWPLASAPRHALAFAGPLAQRYLRIATNRNYYIWSRRLDLDPYQFPFLEILWGVDRFPQQAALDVRGRNDRPIVVMLSFGPKVASPSLLPDVPRALAFFWGETETVGVSYTCVMPRNGPEEVRLQCRYPHVQYVALRRGMTGTVHTDRVNLLDVCFVNPLPVPWERRRPACFRSGLEARAPRRPYTGTGLVKWTSRNVSATLSHVLAGTSACAPGGGGEL